MIHYITSDGLGQPWVGNELREVQRASIPFRLHTMRAPQSVHFVSEWANSLNGHTNVLYPLAILPTLMAFLTGPFLFGARFFTAFGNALFAPRENLRGRCAAISHFFVACVWAKQIRNDDVSHVHSQWAYSSATIGMYATWLLGRSFSFTGHATDLFRDRVALKDKIKRAEFIVCISEFHREFYLQEGARPEQLHIAYCGINPELFAVQDHARTEGTPYRILSSGRLVEKKGFSDLIKACAILRDRDFEFECVIAGSGELDAELRAEIREHDLDSLVTLTGKALKQEHIPDFMRGGDVYCLPCVWASDNDVDGLPQMLMEAMACGIPAISTRLVGIPDLIIHNETGLLVEPNKPTEVADAIQQLAGDPRRAEQFARNGRSIIETKFNLETSLEPLIAFYRRKLGLDSMPASQMPTTDSAGAPAKHNSINAA